MRLFLQMRFATISCFFLLKSPPIIKRLTVRQFVKKYLLQNFSGKILYSSVVVVVVVEKKTFCDKNRQPIIS
jgi:hypothetical protein